MWEIILLLSCDRKGLNVSKPAAIAGEEVVATGFVGGHAGNYIEEALKPFGIQSE